MVSSPSLHVASLAWLTAVRMCMCSPTPIAPIITPRQANVSSASFDYVVIGGGTAGLTIAARLAQGSFSVAVVEAGGFYEEDIGDLGVIPAFAVYGAGASPDDVLPAVDWGFVTTPQAGLNNRKLHYARGKTLGGSSARNYYTYQRPTVDSLKQWAEVVDDVSYTYENFEPFYKKSVRYTPPNNSIRPENASIPPATTAFDAGAGPLHVSFSDHWVNPISSFFRDAWVKLGLPVANDFVSGTLFGVQYSANTINPARNTRDSSYTSFVRGLPTTNTLHVYNNTLAKRIIFEGKTAVGAAVSSNGNEYVLSAKKEVILSAGAFQSPQLLMVSGVGPKETLSKFNIPLVSELSGVGKNLEDHLLFGATYQVRPITHSALSNADYLPAASAEYASTGGSMLSNPGGEIIAWEKVVAAGSPSSTNVSASSRAVLNSVPYDWPDLEYLMLDAYSGDNQNYIQGAPKTSYMYASPAAAVMVPQSRGSITISSNDTEVPPVIDPNWLTHPSDQELSLYAFKRLREMMDTDVMKAAWIEEVVPGRNVSSDAGIMDAIRKTAIQVFHASCTCRMGRNPETGAVVDSHARVFGTERLRVVDASAMPFLPPGHPQATIYALAEKVAEEILRSGGK